MMWTHCFSCPNASLALQNGGFGPREWLVANGPINAHFHFDSIRMSRCFCEQLYFTLEVNPVIFASYVNVKTVFFRSILSLMRLFFKLSAVFRIIVSTLPPGGRGALTEVFYPKTVHLASLLTNCLRQETFSCPLFMSDLNKRNRYLKLLW